MLFVYQYFSLSTAYVKERAAKNRWQIGEMKTRNPFAEMHWH